MGISSSLAAVGSWLSSNAAVITAASAATAAAGTAYSALSAKTPQAPQLPAPVAMPPPVDQTQLQQQQSLADQMARRGRASTVLTNAPDQSKLGS